ncbi:hypothetical protein H310_03703 [Aphanomyces invadans]|uniref:Uncharacterized protein n=1 Tax=Aphanomyces invadans TaxID=157072 RepID=A0A024UIU0_9STRA|nr:hypothetical protein H310_03703 [Aphanomyces invadans]ETW06110.1 hypothetical protein H310_03703 [Aphanomyces invadans]|eukprot:XP_008865887.1 hypothetical protein H310_03703 [Aphanomyces invadans]
MVAVVSRFMTDFRRRPYLALHIKGRQNAYAYCGTVDSFTFLVHTSNEMKAILADFGVDFMG